MIDSSDKKLCKLIKKNKSQALNINKMQKEIPKNKFIGKAE